MNDLINELQLRIRSKIIKNYDMGKSTWFRTGGKANGYVIVNNIKDLKNILSYDEYLKYYIIGVGSNLLVRDIGFDGLILTSMYRTQCSAALRTVSSSKSGSALRIAAE